ncbi:MAG TPA: hypothetical protein VLL97_03280 [Acidobacteriota bacterium]|nr:hypothetical protein [Acidobacteriota bacterium]
MKLAGVMLNSLGNVLANGFLILMTVVFMLLEASGLPRKIQAVAAASETYRQRMESFRIDVKHYVAIKTATSLAIGILIFGAKQKFSTSACQKYTGLGTVVMNGAA